MIPFLGYSPDLDPTTPGMMLNCSAIVPTVKGFKGAPSAVNLGIATLGGQCLGAFLLRKNDDTTRLFAATSSTMNELSGTSWTVRTPDSSGSTLNGLGTGNNWCFTQFGDACLAAAKTEIPKFLTTATTFANVTASAPKAGIIEVANNFTLLFDVNDVSSLFDGADRPNGWWCAAKGGYTNYTPSGTTEAATGTLHSTPGKITAGRAFGYQVVAYKLRSMYLGTYVGNPLIWDFQLLPGTAGALSQNVVVNVGTPENPRHIFMGPDNFWQFAGGQALPIGNELKDTVFGELNINYYYAARALHDRKGKTVRFYYPSITSNTPDKCVVYNYQTGKWGRDDKQITETLQYAASTKTYNDIATDYTTYDTAEVRTYDTTFISITGDEQPAVFDTTNTLVTLNGASVQSSITLGDYGDPQTYSTVTRIIPQFLTAPESASFVNFYKDNLSDSRTSDQTTTMSSGRFDFLRSARWHSGRLDMVGDHEIVGINPQSVEDGEE